MIARFASPARRRSSCGATAVPVHQNLLFADRNQARNMQRGCLALRYCRDCGFVWNAEFEPELLSYGSDYDNTQGLSDAFAGHLEQMVRHLVDERGARHVSILEVGCGKGTFLRMLVSDPALGNTGIGYDPSYVGPLSDLGGRLEFRREYFDSQRLKVAADIVVSRHVIEHIAQPVAFLANVGETLSAQPQARLFLETPCVEWILRNQVFWDVFYEHCSLFSANSLQTTLRGAGLETIRVDHVFGGQYLWVEARAAKAPAARSLGAGPIPLLADAFKAAEQQQQARWLKTIAAHRAGRRLVLWGAGAKGVTFANQVDPKGENIACVVDINPQKQGRFLPGTGHAIVPPAALSELGDATVLVLNPNYLEEIRRTVRDVSPGAGVVDCMKMERTAA